jgi:hypothetical protein
LPPISAALNAQKLAIAFNQSGELTQLYRQIGISAVAAAARYHEGAAKKPAYASAKDNRHNLAGEAA